MGAILNLELLMTGKYRLLNAGIRSLQLAVLHGSTSNASTGSALPLTLTGDAI